MKRVLQTNWLDIRLMRDWPYPAWQGFQYDYIEDIQIAEALADDRIVNVNASLDWEADHWLMESDIAEDKKHSYRVAAIILALMNGGYLSKIELDTYALNCCSCVPNGHHRVRALEYLKCRVAPFGLQGTLDELEQLVELSGVPAKQAKRILANSLRREK